jgi:hypothetical protein
MIMQMLVTITRALKVNKVGFENRILNRTGDLGGSLILQLAYLKTAR